MLKAVIFDLDGLMVDSTPVHQEANHIFLSQFGKVHLPGFGGREGMRIIDIIRDYKDIYDLPGDINELYRKRQEIFFGLARKNLQLFPGLTLLLDKLKQRKLLLAIATSGDKEYLKLIFDKFPKLRSYFKIVVTGEDVERGKPYPDIYLITLEKLGIKSVDAVVLEDSFNGIMSAKSAGIQVVAIPNKRFPEADYTQADKVFASLSDFTEALN